MAYLNELECLVLSVKGGSLFEGLVCLEEARQEAWPDSTSSEAAIERKSPLRSTTPACLESDGEGISLGWAPLRYRSAWLEVSGTGSKSELPTKHLCKTIGNLGWRLLPEG